MRRLGIGPTVIENNPKEDEMQRKDIFGSEMKPFTQGIHQNPSIRFKTAGA